jgi:hypothetical protein
VLIGNQFKKTANISFFTGRTCQPDPQIQPNPPSGTLYLRLCHLGPRKRRALSWRPHLSGAFVPQSSAAPLLARSQRAAANPKPAAPRQAAQARHRLAARPAPAARTFWRQIAHSRAGPAPALPPAALAQLPCAPPGVPACHWLPRGGTPCTHAPLTDRCVWSTP